MLRIVGKIAFEENCEFELNLIYIVDPLPKTCPVGDIKLSNYVHLLKSLTYCGNEMTNNVT